MPYKPKIKTCNNCGKEFLAKDHRVMHCGRSCALSGSKSYLWKGDSVGIDALHTYMKKHVPDKGVCKTCGSRGKVDLANISNEYRRDISDWKWLCRKCHMTEDGRLERFLSHSRKRLLPLKKCPQCFKEFKPPLSKSIFCSRSCRATYHNKKERKNIPEQLLKNLKHL